MITQDIYIKRYDWVIRVFYCYDGYDVDTINNDLVDIECDYTTLLSIRKIMTDKRVNEGATYTNIENRSSIVIIGPTDSAKEFASTYDHEKGHLVTHIATANNIDPYSEEFQYLNGDIGSIMFTIAKKFLCDECRIKMLNEVNG